MVTHISRREFRGIVVSSAVAIGFSGNLLADPVSNDKGVVSGRADAGVCGCLTLVAGFPALRAHFGVAEESGKRLRA